MNKDVAVKLRDKAEEIARKYSHTRGLNQGADVYEVEVIKPLSGTTAAITLRRENQKRVIAFCYYIEYSGGYWTYFLPKDSDIIGMAAFAPLKQKIEEINYAFNFIGESK